MIPSKQKTAINLLAVLSLIALTGCFSMTRMSLRAPKLNVPASFTEGIYDANYRLVLKEQYDTLRHFQIKYRVFAINGYFGHKKIDLSDTLNSLVNAAEGDAIVNLKVITQKGPGYGTLNFIGIFTGLVTLGLIAPAKYEAVVEGDIIKVKASVSQSLFTSPSYELCFDKDMNGRFFSACSQEAGYAQ
jgi:hypothetical protein